MQLTLTIVTDELFHIIFDMINLKLQLNLMNSENIRIRMV